MPEQFEVVELLEHDCNAPWADEDLKDINYLLKQLSPYAQPVTWQDVFSICGTKIVFVVRDKTEPRNGSWKIVGMATLVYYKQLLGLVGRVEDVVIDIDFQGRSLGRKLMEVLLDFGKKRGLKHIDLTSAPDRIIANELYKRLGFKVRETNVYRLKLK